MIADIVTLMNPLLRTLATLLCAATLGFPADFPEAQISNKAVSAKLYLPDAERGYYRGTRFDWSGVISSLRANGHEYFGQWFEKYDPKLHDAIQGPVEEFIGPDSTIGYAEAKPGDTFIRIGVGRVRKPDESPYQRFKTYDIVDPGKWTVKPGRDRIEFTHELSDPAGYAYRYTKTVRLMGDKPEMVIEHRLENKGSKPLSTMQYNHNFFVIDGQPTGPESSVQFPFDLKAKRAIPESFAEVNGGRIQYVKELQKGESAAGEFEGFGASASDYDVRVENKKAGAGVRVVGDKPIAKLIYWSIRTTTCPEAYVNLQVAPGQQQTWKYTYTFYPVK